MFQLKNIQVVTPEQTCLPTMYALGNLDLLNKKSLGVVGTRKIDSQSTDWLKRNIKRLDKNWVVTSGLALGTDKIAHETALEVGLKTIAVLPSGILNITPRSNIPLAKEIVKNGGLLLSEYKPTAGIDPQFRQYIERNKVIVDLSQSLLVPQFNERSGTRSTVDFAQKQNKLIITQDAQYSGNKFVLNNKNYKTFVI